MDKEVLIRFIQAIESIFSRINSKRLMVLYGVFLFLLYSKEMTEDAVYLGVLCALLTLWSFVHEANKRKGSDSIPVPGTTAP